MAFLEVTGGTEIHGEMHLSGAKNAALPILLCSLLSEGIVELENIPTLMEDIKVAVHVMRRLGAKVTVKGSNVTVDPSGLERFVVPTLLASRIRSSLILLGILLARTGRVEMPFPGGCDIGTRKFDLHIEGLRRIGAEIDKDSKGIVGTVGTFKGANVDFYLPSTTGTQNVIIGACLARGRTVLRNANTRPENEDFANFLNSMGAKVRMSSRLVTIDGVRRLKGTRYRIMSGGDEAMTWMIAAGITGGEVVIKDYDLSTLRVDTQYLRDAGMEIFEWGGSVYVSGKKGIRPFDMFTAPYPGVNSDMQPLFAALALAATGTSTITDQRFTDRFAYVKELRAFGARIDHYGNCAVVHGGRKLKGTRVRATDLRGGTAALLTALAATGKTRIDNIYQIDRGYERIERKLGALGARIARKR
ncbi:MAG: UDP-N-acetylglucosamine 1-carboxyvinyltransferase [bacterium]|nr:MAG: UDP-N-acetylglucosamine 1-carboxyvinyltransferase [bacterium]